ncbi:MAG: MoaD/ThiS family protein [Proteobacteria bacterium]|nr:MoaD/ThiS family protein [Pseudomonadota bacterium]
MSITLWLSTNLSRIAKGKEGFEVDGDTVGECINDLLDIVPAMKNALFYESQLNANVQVQVNKESVNEKERLTKKVKDGDEIRIVMKGY